MVVQIERGKKMLTRSILCLSYLGSYFILVSSAQPIEVCKTALDCIYLERSGVNFFCYKGQCSECFNCSIVNRQSNNHCSPSPNDCGDCIEGFKEFSITTATRKKKPCIPQIQAVQSNAIQVADSNSCRTDDSCPRGHFCHNRACAECLDCGLYKRHPPRHACAKSPVECGECLYGFGEMAVTSGARPSKPCQPQRPQQTPAPLLAAGRGPHVSAATLSVLCVALVSVAAGVLLSVCVLVSRDKCPVQTHSVVTYETRVPPPPYSSAAPGVSISEEQTTVATLYGERKEVDNTAKLLQPACAAYYPRDEPEARPGGLEAEDEATQPSDWTPRRSPASHSLNLSFSGLVLPIGEASSPQPHHLAGSASCPDLSSPGHPSSPPLSSNMDEGGTPTSHLPKRRKLMD